ncbi:uncharacterized protein G2W53_026741 [Senna tora]|uniref:Uncharacterized protein n=1 Tax=Senna tora TaxID=362788 RepID=A0A834WJ19_9FABA|nr:uncharacterized protein G2W53_026741 [Senna tora]
MWKLQGVVTVKSQLRNFYALEFENDQNWTFMIKNGLWVVQNSLLEIDKWQTELKANNLRPETETPSEGKSKETHLQPRKKIDERERARLWVRRSEDQSWKLESKERGRTVSIKKPSSNLSPPFKPLEEAGFEFSLGRQRYEISDEYPPPVLNVISGDWSSNSSDGEQSNIPHHHIINHQPQSPEKRFSSEVTQQLNPLLSDQQHVEQQIINSPPHERNHENIVGALNEMDMVNPIVGAQSVISEEEINTPLDLSLHDLICHEDLDGFNGDDMPEDEELQDFNCSDDSEDTFPLYEDDMDFDDPVGDSCDKLVESVQPVYQSHCGVGPLPKWALV